ncbi:MULTISPECIES: hypothetical protein [unclassified Janthinobacterium]|uniref:hypothetical protein n=1 Tax=unclassified Janthinobacterium TaxID=2610881 RepID=UPI0012F777BF|nr:MULTISPECIES: hypothetical protein [unclassified Janthinobacterium]MEC5161702.1 hypothetical protein [Janthinobacterium sp. CG_S6]
MNSSTEPLFSYVKRHLAATRGRWPAVSAASGVPISTLRKIASGYIPDPGIAKIQALADHFSKLGSQDVAP